MSSKDVAVVAILASLYASCVYVLAPISFWLANIRVANALRCFIPIFGWPAIAGLTIGVAVANVISPVGALDLLSPIAILPSFILLYKLRDRSVLAGFFTVFLNVSLWVSFIISVVASMPFLAVFSMVAPGVFVSDVVLPYALLKGILKFVPSWDWRKKISNND